MRAVASPLALLAALAFAQPYAAAPAAAQMPLAEPGRPMMLPPPLSNPPGTRPAATRQAPRSIAPIAPAARTKTVLSLTALPTEGGRSIGTGLRWRVFADQPDIAGNYPLVEDTTEPQPLLTLDPGGYIVHVSYGLATATRHVQLGLTAQNTPFVLECGALRFTGVIGKAKIPASEDLTFDIHKVDGGIEVPIATGIRAGQVVRIPAGAYQITSTYGSTNARVISEVRVQAGKLIDASVHHRAGRVQLRLTENGRPARSDDTHWNVLTPGGDTVAELSGAPELVLAEGDYVAVARRDGRTYQRPFSVKSGVRAAVDLKLE